MLDFIAHFLTTITTLLFPIFASYKALRTSDPAQLTPWLMYWTVLSVLLLAENTLDFVLCWVPFYAWLRLGLHLYLLAPSEHAGATFLYTEYMHPFLARHEQQIDEFISDSHDKAKKAGLQYLKQLIEWTKVNLLGMQPTPPPAHPAAAPTGSYAQQLLARFNLPSARDGLAAPAGDFYALLASALQAATTTSSAAAAAPSSRDAQAQNLSASGTLIPPEMSRNSPDERLSYLSAQRERLRVLLQAFDREAYNIASSEPASAPAAASSSSSEPGKGEGLSKSRSELDFAKIDHDDAPSGEAAASTQPQTPSVGSAGGGWMPWNWGAKGAATSPGEGHAKEE